MATPNLAITHIVSAQAQKEITANEAFDAFDRALTEALTVDFTAGDVTLTAVQLRAAIAVIAANVGVPRTLTLPALRRLFVVVNTGTAALTVARGTTGIAVPAGTAAVFYTDASNDGVWPAVAAAAAMPYDIACYVPGALTDNQVLLRFVAPRALLLPAGLTGSRGITGTAPPAQTDIGIEVGGVSRGTVRFAAAATTATFIAASPVSLAAGDVLTLVAPAAGAAVLADVAITLAGTR